MISYGSSSVKDVEVLRQKKITSFSCEDITAKVRRNNFSAKIQGRIYYEKPTNFRFILKSIMGLELDLGSNSQVFWYWSRRDGEPGLHFAKHEDLGKTRLKASFNPMIMLGSLGINEIKFTENMSYYETGDLFVLRERTISKSTRQKVINTIFINKTMNKIVAFYVHDGITNKLIGTNQLKYINNILSEISYSSPEENSGMTLIFSNPKVNSKIDEKMWVMPDDSKKIDMGKGL